MKALEIRGMLCRLDEIKNDLRALQHAVDGYIETVWLSENAVMIVDDEGLLKALPVNAMAMMIADYPMLTGTALIVGLMPTDDGDVFTDCPQRFIRFAESIRQI